MNEPTAKSRKSGISHDRKDRLRRPARELKAPEREFRHGSRRDTAPRVESPDSAAAECRHVYHPSFALAKTEQRLWGPDSREIPIPRYNLLPEIEEGSPETAPRQPAIRSEDERALFLRYNYAKYRLSRLLCRSQGASAPADRGQVALWRHRAAECREKLVHANLPLVPAMARRVNISGVEFRDLVSEGYMAILRCIDKFDVSRGYKFSTYACRSILACFYRLGQTARTYRKHFPTQFDPELERSDFAQNRAEAQRADVMDAVRQVLGRNSAKLTELEADVIEKRYPLLPDVSPMTLLQVSRTVNLSYERVRQIERRTLLKLQEAVENRLWSRAG